MEENLDNNSDSILVGVEETSAASDVAKILEGSAHVEGGVSNLIMVEETSEDAKIPEDLVSVNIDVAQSKTEDAASYVAKYAEELASVGSEVRNRIGVEDKLVAADVADVPEELAAVQSEVAQGKIEDPEAEENGPG